MARRLGAAVTAGAGGWGQKSHSHTVPTQQGQLASLQLQDRNLPAAGTLSSVLGGPSSLSLRLQPERRAQLPPVLRAALLSETWRGGKRLPGDQGWPQARGSSLCWVLGPPHPPAVWLGPLESGVSCE